MSRYFVEEREKDKGIFKDKGLTDDNFQFYCLKIFFKKRFNHLIEYLIFSV